MSARRRTAARLAGIVLAVAGVFDAPSAWAVTCGGQGGTLPRLDSPSGSAYGGQGGTLPRLDSPSGRAYGGQGGTLPRLDSPSGRAYGGQGATLPPLDPQCPSRDSGADRSAVPITGRDLELAAAVALALLAIGGLIRGTASLRRRS